MIIKIYILLLITGWTVCIKSSEQKELLVATEVYNIYIYILHLLINILFNIHVTQLLGGVNIYIYIYI